MEVYMFKEILPIENETKANSIEEAAEIIHHKFNYDNYNIELSEINIDQDGILSSTLTGKIKISDWCPYSKFYPSRF